MPASWIQATKEGGSVTSLDIVEEVSVGDHDPDVLYDVVS